MLLSFNNTPSSEVKQLHSDLDSSLKIASDSTSTSSYDKDNQLLEMNPQCSEEFMSICLDDLQKDAIHRIRSQQQMHTKTLISMFENFQSYLMRYVNTEKEKAIKSLQKSFDSRISQAQELIQGDLQKSQSHLFEPEDSENYFQRCEHTSQFSKKWSELKKICSIAKPELFKDVTLEKCLNEVKTTLKARLGGLIAYKPCKNSTISDEDLCQKLMHSDTIQKRITRKFNMQTQNQALDFISSGNLHIVKTSKGTFSLVKASDLQILTTIQAHNGATFNVKWIEEAKLLISSGADKMVNFYSCSQSNKVTLLKRMSFGRNIFSILPLPHMNRVLLGGENGNLEVIDIKTLKHLKTINTGDKRGVGFQMARHDASGTIAVGFMSGHMAVYDEASLDEIASVSYKGMGWFVNSLCFYNQGTRIMAQTKANGLTIFSFDAEQRKLEKLKQIDLEGYFGCSNMESIDSEGSAIIAQVSKDEIGIYAEEGNELVSKKILKMDNQIEGFRINRENSSLSVVSQNCLAIFDL